MLDATPLIHLARSGGLRILKGLKTRVYIPRAVYDEVVVEGRRLGKPGAELVDEYVKDEMITIRSPSEKTTISSLATSSPRDFGSPLGRGEVEVLALARELNCTAIIDEQTGRNVAKLHGISVHGTVYLLVLAQRSGFITKAETVAMFKRMVAEGWRISVDDYAAIMEELERL